MPTRLVWQSLPCWHLAPSLPGFTSSLGRSAFLGLFMALGIPAIAWIENSALILVLIAAGVFGILAVFWWHWHEKRARPVAR